MSKYYNNMTNDTNISQRIGSNVNLPIEFELLSARILSQCIFSQSLIQQIIYISHGKELSGAKKTLKTFPNPKSRFDFICSFPYKDDDPVVTKVFNFARTLFNDIYDLRNTLAHEIWGSSDAHPNLILFSNLDENARLQMATGRLWHLDDTTSQETHEAIIRFIKSIKSVSINNLKAALNDINLCNWCFLIIINILSESDKGKKEEARKPLFVYNGTSHLFPEMKISDVVEFKASKSKSINK